MVTVRVPMCPANLFLIQGYKPTSSRATLAVASTVFSVSGQRNGWASTEPLGSARGAGPWESSLAIGPPTVGIPNNFCPSCFYGDIVLRRVP